MDSVDNQAAGGYSEDPGEIGFVISRGELKTEKAKSEKGFLMRSFNQVMTGEWNLDNLCWAVFVVQYGCLIIVRRKGAFNVF